MCFSDLRRNCHLRRRRAPGNAVANPLIPLQPMPPNPPPPAPPAPPAPPVPAPAAGNAAPPYNPTAPLPPLPPANAAAPVVNAVAPGPAAPPAGTGGNAATPATTAAPAAATATGAPPDSVEAPPSDTDEGPPQALKSPEQYYGPGYYQGPIQRGPGDRPHLEFVPITGPYAGIPVYVKDMESFPSKKAKQLKDLESQQTNLAQAADSWISDLYDD